MKVLLDTNIILDIALQRQPYFDESNQLLSLVQEKQLEGYVSASTFGDLYYIIRKAQGRELTLDFLTRLATICRVAAVNEAAITPALNANFRDFEDAIQYSTAAINHLDAIVTRNPQDFTNVTLRIFTPSRLIEELGV
jgi:predicted nucleic acid-binding protein